MQLPQPFIDRASRLLNLADYFATIAPIAIMSRGFDVPCDRQYILRMMVRSPESDGFRIPKELGWLESTILELDAIQKQNGLANHYAYVTVRHGEVTSETDDTWHVDGFSMRAPHMPEQNYIWTNRAPTEYVEQAFDIPESFDPMRHNINLYFDETVKSENVRACDEGTVYLFDPYLVHRRPPGVSGMTRTFWRVSFIPTEIEDNQCQHNPLMPSRTYIRDDIRTRLSRWTA